MSILTAVDLEAYDTYYGECCPPAYDDRCSLCDERVCSDAACAVEGVDCLEAPGTSHCRDCVTDCRGCVVELRDDREPESRADR